MHCRQGFNSLDLHYDAFCALPEEMRVFYALVDGKIVEQKLDEASWKPSAWGDNPELPVPGGSWDGVPMVAPVSGLSGEGPYQPTWDSMLQYEVPDWYRDAKFGIWAHWSPQCVPEDGDWYARNMYIEGQRQYKYQLEHYGPQSKFGYKDLTAQWTLLNWDPDGLIQRYKEAGARLFIALANHHDGFDAWDSKHQPWNAAKHRSASRRCRDVGGGGAQTRAPLRRHHPPGAQLVVVPALARRRQNRPERRRSLRRPHDLIRWQGAVVAGTRSPAALRTQASIQCATRSVLREELLRPHARRDRSARSRPGLLRQCAAQ